MLVVFTTNSTWSIGRSQCAGIRSTRGGGDLSQTKMTKSRASSLKTKAWKSSHPPLPCPNRRPGDVSLLRFLKSSSPVQFLVRIWKDAGIYATHQTTSRSERESEVYAQNFMAWVLSNDCFGNFVPVIIFFLRILWSVIVFVALPLLIRVSK